MRAGSKRGAGGHFDGGVGLDLHVEAEGAGTVELDMVLPEKGLQTAREVDAQPRGEALQAREV